jgi:tRNA dimethylallyltransferase
MCFLERMINCDLLQEEPMNKILLIIAGPTASGKTQFAVDLALQLKTEVLSCDSRQFYKELNIGVAMPDQSILQAVPHHFIRSHSILTPLNAFDFAMMVDQLLENLFQKHDICILTGGSGLFLKAVYHGIDEFPDPSKKLRRELDAMKLQNYPKMLDMLKELDPQFYNEVDVNNPARVQRALEVCLASGERFSELRKNVPAEKKYRILKYAFMPSREELSSRIDLRLENMRSAGLTDEARSLLKYRHLSPLKTIGYRELFAYFDGEYSEDEAYAKISVNTRRYAKKQLTWLRKEGFKKIQDDSFKDTLKLFE